MHVTGLLLHLAKSDVFGVQTERNSTKCPGGVEPVPLCAWGFSPRVSPTSEPISERRASRFPRARVKGRAFGRVDFERFQVRDNMRSLEDKIMQEGPVLGSKGAAVDTLLDKGLWLKNEAPKSKWNPW